MKTKLLTFVLLTLVLTTSVFAKENAQMKVIPLNNTKLLVAFIQDSPVNNQLSICNESGEVMYIKRLKKGTFSYQQVYNLSKVADGNYEVRLKYGNEILKKSIKVSDGKVEEIKQISAIPPVFSSTENGINLTYLNAEKNEVSLHVYEEGTLIKTADLGSEYAIHKKINLAATDKGTYNILLASADKEYWFSVQR